MAVDASSKLRVLVLGSGGREHALAWKLAQSPRLEALYAMPGNPGFVSVGATLVEGNVMDFEAVKQAVLKEKIDLVVVGRSAPVCRDSRLFPERAGTKGGEHLWPYESVCHSRV